MKFVGTGLVPQGEATLCLSGIREIRRRLLRQPTIAGQSLLLREPKLARYVRIIEQNGSQLLTESNELKVAGNL